MKIEKSKRLRILFVNSIQMFGGGEIWMLTTLTELQRRGHHVGLLCRPGTELTRRAVIAGIPVHTLLMRGDFDPITIFEVYRFLKRECYQIILTNMDKELRFAGIAARLAGIRHVFPRRGIDYPLKNKWRYRFAYHHLAWRVIANSQATKHALLRNAPWLEEDRISVVYNGIDPGRFEGSSKTDLRRELEIERAAPIIGFVGHLDERKGIHTLLPAIKQVHSQFPAPIFLLVGEGQLECHIRNWCLQHKIDSNVRLVGFRDDIPEIMKSIDMLVLPSLWEGFGIVLIEAMAAAKACVTTNVSSMPEIVVDGETGLIVPANDAAALSDAIIKLLMKPQLLSELGENGRQRVFNMFTLSGMVDRLESIFSDALESASC
jgi:glycosyltransferase involved in cell wall biosynthesis